MTEREYENDCALEARNARMAAEACNYILTRRQAEFALDCIQQAPNESMYLVEDLFDTHGWPSDDLDTAWLDDAGRVTWELFTAYRAVGAA
jgi:hypothetical protein